MEQLIFTSYIVRDFLIPVLIGSKIFFSLIVAPNTFQTLNEQFARKFIRSIFPKLYLWCLVISFFITLSLISLNIFHAFIFFLITTGYFYSREFLMKKINKASDSIKQKKSSSKNFKRLHTLSVLIFITQLITVFLIFVVTRG